MKPNVDKFNRTAAIYGLPIHASALPGHKFLFQIQGKGTQCSVFLALSGTVAIHIHAL